jgi:membrane-associated phospholipid phosphatase
MSLIRRPSRIGWASIGVAFGASSLAPVTATAQIDIRPRSAVFWITTAAGITGAALLDQRIRSTTLAHESGPLSTVADAGNALGTGRNLIAALLVTYVGARLLHHRALADDVLRASAGYAASNAIVGLLKPAVGRHRPDSTNDAWRFHPFSAAGAWHSLPSSHAVHAFSLAAGASVVSRRPWLGALAYTEASVVAWSRVYDDQHWASDVTASAALGIATAASTVRWLDRRFPPRQARATGR